MKLAVRKGQGDAPGGLGGVTQFAFPSGHATLAAAVYGTTAVLLFLAAATASTRSGRWVRSAGAVGLVGLVLTVGVARVYLGQHDPTDVLAGWLLGGLWAGQISRWTVWTEKRRQPQAPARTVWARPAGT